MANIASVFDKIGDIVDTISASVLPVKYRYPEGNPTAFPASILLFAGDTERMVDTATNEVDMAFDIMIVYPADESAAGYAKWLAIYDTLKTELRKDDHQTLSGDAVRFMIETTGKPSFTDQYGQIVAVLNVRVTAKVLQSITT